MNSYCKNNLNSYCKNNLNSYRKKYYKYKTKYRNLKANQTGGNIPFTVSFRPATRQVFTQIARENMTNEFKVFTMESERLTQDNITNMMNGIPIDRKVIDNSMASMIHKYLPKYFSCFMNQNHDYGGKLYFGLSDEGYILGIPRFDTDYSTVSEIIYQETRAALRNVQIVPVNDKLLDNPFQLVVEIEDLVPPNFADIPITKLLQEQQAGPAKGKRTNSLLDIFSSSLELPTLVSQFQNLQNCSRNLKKASELFREKLDSHSIYHYLNHSHRYTEVLETLRSDPTTPCTTHSADSLIINLDLKQRLPMYILRNDDPIFMILKDRTDTHVIFQELLSEQLIQKEYADIYFHIIWDVDTWCMPFREFDAMMEKHTIRVRNEIIREYKNKDCKEVKFDSLVMSYFRKFPNFYKFYLDAGTPIKFFMVTFTIIKNAKYMAGRDYEVEYMDAGQVKKGFRRLRKDDDPECRTVKKTDHKN